MYVLVTYRLPNQPYGVTHIRGTGTSFGQSLRGTRADTFTPQRHGSVSSGLFFFFFALAFPSPRPRAPKRPERPEGGGDAACLAISDDCDACDDEDRSTKMGIDKDCGLIVS